MKVRKIEGAAFLARTARAQKVRPSFILVRDDGAVRGGITHPICEVSSERTGKKNQKKTV